MSVTQSLLLQPSLSLTCCHFDFFIAIKRALFHRQICCFFIGIQHLQESLYMCGGLVGVGMTLCVCVCVWRVVGVGMTLCVVVGVGMTLCVAIGSCGDDFVCV